MGKGNKVRKREIKKPKQDKKIAKSAPVAVPTPAFGSYEAFGQAGVSNQQ